ncbi:MAG: M20/M25/M40 family metallo-hydrolase [Syntrophomonas sp.]
MLSILYIMINKHEKYIFITFYIFAPAAGWGVYMEQSVIESIGRLRSELYKLAERSGEEKKTKACLMEFLRNHTSLRLQDEGQWFCAMHEEPEAAETIAFRAEMDALPFGDGAAHLCGHDGHMAVLAGLGLLLEHKKVGRNIVLIFQHAEENGTGGKVCCQALETYRVSRVYSFHNIPGWPEGAVLLRYGTFACASRGMILSLTGAPCHAAYPEHGRNPGFAVARFISALPALANRSDYRGLTMATLIGAEIGSKAFGSAAEKAEVWLTLRAWYEDDLNLLISSIEETAGMEAARDDLEVSFYFDNVFPATVSDRGALAQVKKICRKAGLEYMEVPEPFRWSEDFGHYGAVAPAVMVGIGAGTEWPHLHTENYTFNDSILPVSLTLFSALAEFG